MATVMRALFSPLVEFVYSYDGFVTGFAGDAFTAVFPVEANAPHTAAERAIATAAQVQQHMRNHADHKTDYGTFSFAIKVGIATGETAWGILAGERPGQHTYYFSGYAINECAHAEHFAERGDVIVSAEILTAGRHLLTAEPIDGTADFLRVTEFRSVDIIKQQAADPTAVQISMAQAAAFMPEAVLTEETVYGEFRQIISMFISLDGVSTHTQLTEFMHAVFTLQTNYGGFFNRIDFGDKGCNLLIFWGAPSAHENDVDRALHFILDLQQHVDFKMRIGITYYIAHAGYVGAPVREEYTCLSRGVNLAARHMMAADWGQIWLDERLADRAADAFDIDFHEYLPFKGFAEPQPVYQLRGREIITARSAFQGRMIGRNTELRALLTGLEPLQSGQFVGVLSVFGEAGMGKSRLIHELSRRVQTLEQPPQWFFCPADEILKQSLNPFRYWLRRYFDQANNHTEVENKLRFDTKLAKLIEQTAEPTLRSELDRTRSLLGALIDLYWPDSLYEQLEPQLRFENSLEALKSLLKAESLRQPVIIELDDVHWADDDTVRFARQLTHNVENYPLAIITASREALPEDMFDPNTVKQSISLNTLTQDGVRRFMQMMLQQPPSDALVRFLADRTDGNPFYLEQAILYLKEQGALSPTAGEDTLSLTFAIPTDVQAILVARLDRLTQDVRRIVQTASVLGREFETRLLSQMLRSERHIRDKVEAAEHAAVWVSLTEIRYIFKHGMMREAAYGMQLRSRLQDLHYLAATSLEILYQDDVAPHYAEIAYHYDQSHRAEEAAQYYFKAGDHAKNNYHNEEAQQYFRRALTLIDSWADMRQAQKMRYDLLLAREELYNLLGKREAQTADLETLTPIAAEIGVNAQATVALRQANYALVTNAYTAAEQAAAQAVQYAQSAERARLEGSGYLVWGKAAMRLGNYQEALTLLEQALALTRTTNSRFEEADTLMTLGHVYWNQGHLDQAKRHLQDALGIQRDINHRRGEAGALNALGAIHSETGDYVTAAGYSESVLEICRDIGYRQGETIILRNLGADHNDLGDYGAAQIYLLQAQASCQEINDQWGVAICLDTLGLVENGLGNLGQARMYHEEALTLQKEIGDQDGQGYTYSHLGHTLSALAQWADAAEAYQQAAVIRQQLDQEPLNVDNLAGLAHVYAQRGAFSEAETQMAQALTHLTENGIDGVEYPILAYWHCYLAAVLLHEQGMAQGYSSGELLDKAHALLKQRADNIKSDFVREQFLHNVPYHGAIVEAVG